MNSTLAIACDRIRAGTDERTAPAGIAFGVRTPTGEWITHLGSRNLNGDPFTSADRVDIASVTKVVATTTALMRLVTEGVLALDDEAARFVPALSTSDKRKITIRDLLCHRAGLWEWQPLYLSPVCRTSPEAALMHAAQLPLRYPVGHGRHYSDLGYMFLGEVISGASGQPLEKAIGDLVLDPLGLPDTGYLTRDAGPATFVTSAPGDAVERAMVETGVPYPILEPHEFRGWRDRPLTAEVNDGNAHHVLDSVSGHAGLFATLDDLLRFSTVMSELSRWEDLFAPHVVDEFFSENRDPGQALGFRREDHTVAGRNLTLLGHPGFTGCAIGFVPEAGVAISVASNRLLTPGTPMATKEIWDVTVQSLLNELKEDPS